MANDFYQPGEQRAQRVRELFSRIARQYDLVNDVQSFGLHRFWKKRLVQLAQARDGERALDICCGTGDLAFRLARTGVRVVGADFTENMLSVAASRGHASNAIENNAPARTNSSPEESPEFVQADAMALPFGDASFDVVTMAYGLRNLADVKSGLREMQRVAKPGARLLILEFGKPDQPVWRSIYYGYLRLFVPVLGRVFCGSASAYAYILESLKNYPGQHGVAEYLRELNLVQVRIISFWGGIMTIHYAEKGRVT